MSYTGTLIRGLEARVDQHLLALKILAEFPCEAEPENGEACGQPSTVFDRTDERFKCQRCLAKGY